MLLLTLYASIGLLTGLCYGIYWLKCKGRVDKPVAFKGMLMRATLYALLWPVVWFLVLHEPDVSHFLTHNESVNLPKVNIDSYAWQERQWQNFVSNLPVCGKQLVYRGTDIYGEKLPATFIFASEGLLPIIFDAIRANNPEPYCHERILYRWLLACDHALEASTFVSHKLDRFDYIVVKMIKKLSGNVYCQDCQHLYSAAAITCSVEGTMGNSWISDALYCPNQHLLLRNKSVHFCRSNPA